MPCSSYLQNISWMYTLSSPFPDPTSLSHIICQVDYYKTSTSLPTLLFPLRAPIHLLLMEIFLKIKQGLIKLGAQNYSNRTEFKVLEINIKVLSWPWHTPSLLYNALLKLIVLQLH